MSKFELIPLCDIDLDEMLADIPDEEEPDEYDQVVDWLADLG